jgi:hypothetical protein
VVLESTDVGDCPRDGHSGTTYFTKKMKYPCHNMSTSIPAYGSAGDLTRHHEAPNRFSRPFDTAEVGTTVASHHGRNVHSTLRDHIQHSR